MTSSIRVLHCISRMNVGGPALIIDSVMRDLGDDFVQLLVYGECANDELDFFSFNARFYDKLELRKLGRKVRIWHEINAFLQMYVLIRRWRPDIIHTHTFKAGVIGRIAALAGRKGNGRPLLVHTFHGHLLNGYFGTLGTFLLTVIERFLAKRTHALVAVGESVRTDLLTHGVGREQVFRVIEPMISRMPQAVDSTEARAILELDPDTFTIGFLGRLARIKRVDRFLEAVSGLQIPHQVVIAGDGVDRPSAQHYARSRSLKVKFLGWRDDIDVIIGACDVIVLTSDNEGAPLSLIEAQLRGKLVVATDVGSIRGSVVLHGETGYVVETSADAIGKAIETVYNLSKTEYEFMSKRATAHASNFFTGSKSIIKHRDLYRELLTSGSHR